ncbi:MAG TPA: M23 family metallopeptidase [Bryobacteraceae bacterium]|nr:M23 family metallopeptidase [Bryobacteraceae bacterium]
MKFIIGGAALIVVVVLVALAAMSGHTGLSANPAPTALGVSTPVKVELANPHGVRRVEAFIEQNGERYQVLDRRTPATRLFWHRHETPFAVMFDAGKDKAPNLKEGAARLVVEAVSNDFRGSTDRAAYDVKVVLAAPRVAADGFQHYVNQGGMELVTFTPGGSWNEAGVKVGKYTFRSFPLPGHPEERFSMFGYPWDLPADITPVVYVRNAAGTEATAHFWFKLFPKKFRVRDFELDDALMEKLVNSVDPSGQILPGKPLLDRFLYINGELRRKNNQQMADLRLKTEEKILWHGPFIHWGKEEADFADTRNYMYHGKKVDQQTHLGFDLSDVIGGPVEAANDGRVVWASDLGIYGNCVVLDHGYGVQSIYGHMQRIDVKVGDMVSKGGKMGIAGQTGLAGGVHVHFSMQVDGVQTNPREWWDEHWIKDRILSKLAPEKIAELSASAAPAPAARAKTGKKHRR